jgi:hypothetical protein
VDYTSDAGLQSDKVAMELVAQGRDKQKKEEIREEKRGEPGTFGLEVKYEHGGDGHSSNHERDDVIR